jgi:hypothetical protein
MGKVVERPQGIAKVCRYSTLSVAPPVSVLGDPRPMPIVTLLALCLTLATACLAPQAHANDAYMPDIRTMPPSEAGVTPAVVAQASQTLPSHPAFRQAVAQYRQGDYTSAYGQFSQLVADYPEEMAYTYYQALAATQLQRYPEAQQLYQNVLWLVPNTPLANLAQQGLQALPLASNPSPANAPLTTWDAPPATPVAGQPAPILTSPSPSGVSAQAFASNPYGRPVQPQGQIGQGNAVSPEMLQQQMQAMMMMQMMAGMGGNTNNADPTGMGMGQGWGINPMMNPAMNPMANPMMNPTGGQPAMDPNMMSQLMMNQLMGNTMGAMESDRDR